MKTKQTWGRECQSLGKQVLGRDLDEGRVRMESLRAVSQCGAHAPQRSNMIFNLKMSY